jgi:hypothetical protein
MTEQEVLHQIESGANEVRATGDELTKRIKKYEAWLNQLPGRVPASCVLSHSDEGDVEERLSFQKDSRAWALHIYTYDNRDESVSDQMLLRDAPIHTKTIAMLQFPALLKAIAESQRSLVSFAKSSMADFDAFAASIGLKEGE